MSYVQPVEYAVKVQSLDNAYMVTGSMKTVQFAGKVASTYGATVTYWSRESHIHNWQPLPALPI